MQEFILIIHILVAICLVVLVLIQHGKGADVGAAFGSGASNTMFGSVGATSFLMKMTAVLAAIFFATSLVQGYLTANRQKQQNSIYIPSSQQVPAESTSNQLPVNSKPKQ